MDRINPSDKKYPFDFSIIAPCYNESESLREFHKRLVTALKGIPFTFELIYINDGSVDDTLGCLLDICNDTDIAVRILDLARNVGQTNASTAGLEYAMGKDIVFIDCDLQADPEDIRLLIEKFDEKHDMVSGARTQRKDNLLRLYISRLGNAVVRGTLGLPLYDFGSGMKILRGTVVHAFEPGPFHPLNPGAIMLSLQHVVEVPINHHVRRYGRTRWTLRRFAALYHNVFKQLIPFIYLFTVVPLFIVSSLAFVYFVLAGFYPTLFPGSNNTAILPILLMLNISLSISHFLLLGEFVMRGDKQVQEPAYIVRQIFRHQKTK
ncbi:MAG: glycosyltransferase family 2 protein [Candidatus Hydrogenedentes bacterium]|nr:glycosyltransferase family 2 protein [Candidatus Hydrogenedentota bacterium]